ncbi:MAG TPA: FHA domain-containing protein, partial [Pirellulales bacterium]|nr:FHA domain-containing protein [Pirellulales bacterium]
MATLEICTPADGSKYYELTADETVVGRDQFCDIVVRNHTVSRRHARIVRRDEGFFIEDLTSLNGTYLNSRRLEGLTAIKDQDRIHIYEVVTIFHEASPEVVQAASGDTLHGEGEAESLIEESLDQRAAASAAPSELPVQAVGEQPAAADSRSQARFRAALKISVDLEGELEIDQILPKTLDCLFEIFPQAVHGYILMSEGADGHLVPRAMKHRQNEAGQSMTFGPISRKTALHVMSTGQAILMDDSPEGAPVEIQQSVFDIRSLSMICAPLMGPS